MPVCVCVSEYMRMCVCTCVGQRRLSGVLLYHVPPSSLKSGSLTEHASCRVFG